MQNILVTARGASGGDENFLYMVFGPSEHDGGIGLVDSTSSENTFKID